MQVVQGLAPTVTDSQITGLEMTLLCLMIYLHTTLRVDRRVSHQRGTTLVDPTRTDQHLAGRTCSLPHRWCLVVEAKICTVPILMNEYTVQVCPLALIRSVYHLVKTSLISKEVLVPHYYHKNPDHFLELIQPMLVCQNEMEVLRIRE